MVINDQLWKLALFLIAVSRKAGSVRSYKRSHLDLRHVDNTYDLSAQIIFI